MIKSSNLESSANLTNRSGLFGIREKFCEKLGKEFAKKLVVACVSIALLMTLAIMKPKCVWADEVGDNSATSWAESEKSQSDDSNILPELDDVLSIADHESIEATLESLKQQKADLENQIQQLKENLESEMTSPEDISIDDIRELEQIVNETEIMMTVLEKATSGDISQIKSIRVEEINALRKYFGDEIADTIQSAVNISKIDAPISKNIDASTLPYSPKTGELQFSEISWANLGPIVGRIHLGWRDKDGKEGHVAASNWTALTGTQRIKLSDFALPDDVEFKFYTEVRLGHDSAWSKWYSYNSSSNFSVGYQTDKTAFSKNYDPEPVIYGEGDFAHKTVEQIANMKFRNTIKTIVMTTAVLLVAAVSVAVTFGLSTAGFALSALIFSAVFGMATSVAFLATDIVLTATMSDIDIEDVDLKKQKRDKNWVSNEEFEKISAKNNVYDGYFAISGFQYVSAGYYWSRPTVHWRSPNEPRATDHQAYVNETPKETPFNPYWAACFPYNEENPNCKMYMHEYLADKLIDKDLRDLYNDGIRMGKAAGAALADLSLTKIVDCHYSDIELKEGDIIWFGSDVLFGKDRISGEKFIYSKTSDYQAGYFTQGTTLMERGQENPVAHLATFGPKDQVAVDMNGYVTTANNQFWSMITDVALSSIFIVVSAVLNGAIIKGQVARIFADMNFKIGDPIFQNLVRYSYVPEGGGVRNMFLRDLFHDCLKMTFTAEQALSLAPVVQSKFAKIAKALAKQIVIGMVMTLYQMSKGGANVQPPM